MPATVFPTRPPAAPPNSPPRAWRWTVEQFNYLGDLGAFEGRRAWLHDGVIVEEGPMNPPHAIAGEKTEEVLRTTFGLGWRIRVQKPLLLSQATDPEPDVAVIPGRPGDSPTHPTTAALVVEISDTTLAQDTTVKAELYATAGILDYWVVDVENRRLLVFRDPQPLPAGLGATAYRTRTTHAVTDTVSPLAAPSAAVRVADLLP
jgi:Uma2 family endonuclease